MLRISTKSSLIQGYNSGLKTNLEKSKIDCKVSKSSFGVNGGNGWSNWPIQVKWILVLIRTFKIDQIDHCNDRFFTGESLPVPLPDDSVWVVIVIPCVLNSCSTLRKGRRDAENIFISLFAGCATIPSSLYRLYLLKSRQFIYFFAWGNFISISEFFKGFLETWLFQVLTWDLEIMFINVGPSQVSTSQLRIHVLPTVIFGDFEGHYFNTTFLHFQIETFSSFRFISDIWFLKTDMFHVYF